MSLAKLNPIEPPWYGPVCPVVWDGRRREASPYPDQCAGWGCRGRLRAEGRHNSEPISSFGNHPVTLREHWPSIRSRLLEGTYQPQPVKRVEIPKVVEQEVA